MNLPQPCVTHITGDADKPANRVVIAEDGSTTLSRAWSAEELAALDRIEKCYEDGIAKSKQAQRDHIESVKEQLNRAQAFAGSSKARKLYRDVLKLIEELSSPNDAAQPTAPLIRANPNSSE